MRINRTFGIVVGACTENGQCHSRFDTTTFRTIPRLEEVGSD